MNPIPSVCVRVLKWGLVPFLLLSLFVGLVEFETIPMTVFSQMEEWGGCGERLKSDGKSVLFADWFRSQYPPEMKTERNAAVGFVRLWGAEVFVPSHSRFWPESDAWQKQVLADLGLEPRLGAKETKVSGRADEKPILRSLREAYSDYLNCVRFPNRGDSFEQAEEFTRAEEQFESLSDDDYARVVSDEVFARFWLEANAPTLDACCEVIRKADFCCFPVVASNEFPNEPRELPGIFDFLWNLDENLHFRAACRIFLGDLDGAIEDQRIWQKLGQQLQKEAFFETEFLGGMRLAGLTAPLGRNAECQPAAEQWKRFFRTAEPFEQMAAAERFLNLNRLHGLSAIQSRSVLGSVCGNPLESGWPRWVGWDLNLAAERFQERIAAQRKLEPESDVLLLDGVPVPFWVYLVPASRSRLLGDLASEYFFSPTLHAILRNAQLKSSRENLQRVACALECWRLEHEGQFPPAFTQTEDGRPLHSWRVLLLPFLGESELFAKIRLDEPWDSAWNSQFHAAVPVVFRSAIPGAASAAFRPGDANVSVVVGEGTLFGGGSGRDRVVRPKDGSEPAVLKKTLLTLRLDPICWMKPDGELTDSEIERAATNENSWHFLLIPTLSSTGETSCRYHFLPEKE